MAGGNHDGVLALSCRVGARVCALPVEDVVETLRPLPVEPVAGAGHFVLGFTILRGDPVLVLDLRRLLGAAPAEARRFVVIRAGARKAALAVDDVLGVRALPRGELAGLPPMLRDAQAGAVAAIGSRDGDLLLVLRAARVVPDATWATWESAGAGR